LWSSRRGMRWCWWSLDRTEGGELVARQALDGPLVHRCGAQVSVDLDGGGVPVEHRPLHPRVAALGADAGQPGHQVPADAAPAVRGGDVEILQPEAVAPGPGREGEIPDGDPDDLAVRLSDVRPRGGRAVLGEERLGVGL